MEVEPQDVVLVGYDWTWFFIALPVTVIVLVAIIVVSNKLDREGAGQGWSFFVNLFGGMIIFGSLIGFLFCGINGSQDWDRAQRLAALEEAGVENAMLLDEGDSRNVPDAWTGSLDGQYALGSFVPQGGEKWTLVGVIND